VLSASAREVLYSSASIPLPSITVTACNSARLRLNLRSEAAGHDDPINVRKVNIGYRLEQEWAVDGHRESLAWQRNWY
jgi:hypothetical protein